MADGFGVSFVPGGQPGQQQPQQDGLGGAPNVANVQRAIQMLSLRLPRVLGAQGLAPGPLLQNQGLGGQPLGSAAINPILQALLRLAGIDNGPGTVTFPGVGGGPTIDRRAPAPGGFGAGVSAPLTPPPTQPPPTPPPPSFSGGSPTRIIPGGEGNRGGGAPTSSFEPIGGAGTGTDFGALPFFRPRGPLTPEP